MLFATHYHHLTAEFGANPAVLLGHMAALVDGDSTDDVVPSQTDTPSSQTHNVSGDITFLYHLSPGACPSSYGLQVAALAGMPGSVLAVASKAASRMQQRLQSTFAGAASHGKEGGLTAEERRSLALLLEGVRKGRSRAT